MKKKHYYLFVLSAVLIMLIYLLLKAREGEIDSTHDTRYSDFAIEDTSAIDKIIISDANGEKVEIKKRGENDWQLNGKYKARIDAVHIILKTARLISVKSEVPKSAEENVLKTMAVTFKKVEYYSHGDLIKTWYVGSPTRDHYGTNMLLELPEHGKSSVPYVMEIKGFFGHLASRFFTDEKEWRDKMIWKLEPTEIASVTFKNNENPEYSFKINVTGKNQFELEGPEGEKINGFDTVAIRSYLLNYRKIAFETFNKGVLSKKQEDSLRKAVPFAVISLKEKAGKETTIKAYRKAPSPDQQNLDGSGYQWDIERCFAILPSDEVVIMQYNTFDKIWRALINFIP